MNTSSVFFAEAYHPIQAGSIDGTDIHPHDNAVCRALLCSTSGLYDPSGDPKVSGDPYCTLFVGRLSHSTTEETLRQAMSEYGKVKNLRLVRHIVTGASRGYAFVEFETEREMCRAYMDAHHTYIDGSEIMVDYNRQQLMPGWIPRRLGGGLGGKKESGQLRFGGRERPFRAPLRQIPYDDLKRLGIPAPPEGRYLSRFEVPSPPRRKRHSVDCEDNHRQGEGSRDFYHSERSPSQPRRPRHRADNSRKRHSSKDSYQPERSASRPRGSRDRADNSSKRHRSRDSYQLETSPSRHKRSRDGAGSSSKSHRSGDANQRERSPSQPRRSRDRADSSSKHHRSSRHSGHRKSSHSRDPFQHVKQPHSSDRSQLHKTYSPEIDRYSPRSNSTPESR